MLRANYFVSFRINNVLLKELVISCQSEMILKYPEMKDYCTAANKLHLTAFVLPLYSEVDINRAEICIERSKSKIMQFYDKYCATAVDSDRIDISAILDAEAVESVPTMELSEPIGIKFCGLDTFNKNVLYIKPLCDQLLRDVSEIFADIKRDMCMEGLVTEADTAPGVSKSSSGEGSSPKADMTVTINTLHCTIAKLSKGRNKRGKHKGKDGRAHTGADHPEAGDAGDGTGAATEDGEESPAAATTGRPAPTRFKVYQEHDRRFHLTVPVQRGSFDLCSMTHPPAPDGFYHSVFNL